MKKNIVRLLAVLIGLFIVISFLSGFLIDYQWFKEAGYAGVFFTSWKAKIMMFIPIFFVLFLIINFYVRFLRNGYLKFGRNIYEKGEIKKQNRIIALITAVISLAIALMFTGVFWYKILEFFNAENFGIKAPIFNVDTGFYLFKLPLIESIIGVLISVVVILIALSLLFYGLVKVKDGFSGLREYLKGQDSPLAKFVMKQLSIFGAILLLLLSGVFYIKTLNLAYSPRGVAFGASYTDVHVTLPMYRVIAIFCIIASFVVAYSLIKKKVKMIILTAVFMAVLIASEGLVSGIVERFVVSPNARDKELPYLKYNIDSTRQAFGLDHIAEKNFAVDNALNADDIEKNMDNIENIRVNEFNQSLEVFNQIQTIRNYYKFNDVDIDRYNIDGKPTQVFIAARELDNTTIDPKYQTWQNMHLYYTHGYGAVMTYTNRASSSGLPEFIMEDMPLQSKAFNIDKPQIYFGEMNDNYVIVGGKNNEIDYPSGNENKENKYDGNTGIKLNFFNRLLFTMDTGNINFLLSNDINSNSRMIMHRNLLNRLSKIAPFFGYDKDPYIVVSNGKLYWIVDAYTVSRRYPFAEQYNGINYMRNSVKVVVDAYNGKTDFYLVDDSDAVAKTIGNIYKGLLKDINRMPEELRAHLRYSEDVFKVQARVYEKYHMTNPVTFYNSQDLWNVAKYKDGDGKEVAAEPVYQMMKLPGEKDEEFLLSIPFTASKRENMVSWLTVRMDEDKPTEIMLVRFTGDKAVYGPNQFNSKINTDTTISSQLTLWGQKGSQVILGETYIMPLENSLIYVRPLYLRAEGGKSLPEMKKVIVGCGDRIVMEDNIEMAFAKLFKANIGEPSGNITAPGEPEEEGISELVKRAAELFKKAKEAQMSGDWAAYGSYLEELEKVINDLQAK